MPEHIKLRAGLVSFFIIFATTGVAELIIAYLLTYRDSDRGQISVGSVASVWTPEWAYVLAIGPPGAGLVGGLLVYLGVNRSLLRLESITRIAQQIGNGAVSERVPMEGAGEIRNLARAINRIAEKFQYVDEHRRSLLAEVSHELRRPLHNVQGFAEIVQHQVLTFADSIQQSTTAMHRQIEAMSRQVDDLRTLSDADSGDLALQRQAEVLAEVLGLAIEGYEANAVERGVAIRSDIPPSLPPVFVDRTRMYQVMGNLIDNALAHTPRGGEIFISAVDRGGDIEVMVRDTGVGIPAGILPHIFDRFFSGDSAPEPMSGRFGLGLAVARQIIESHGGDIRVESEEGKGTAFFITMPVYREAVLRLLPAADLAADGI